MQLIRLNSIDVQVTQTGNDVRVTCVDREVNLVNQSCAVVVDLLAKNFKKVSEHYRNNNAAGIADDYLDYICTKLVLRYLHMYNSWNNWYKKKKPEDLLFKNEDFNYPDTYDDVMSYIRNKYPDTWIEKCAPLLDMTTIQLQEYYTKRLDYYMK